MNRRKRQAGAVMLEFIFAGIATILMLTTTIQMCIGLWNYNTLAYAVHEAARYATSHGRGCVTGTSSCAITVADIGRRIANNSIGMPSDKLSVSLTTDSGAVTNCNPLSSCFTNSTRWPPTTNLDNLTGKFVTIKASYTFTHNMLFFWPGSKPQQFGTFTFPASSSQAIVF